MTHEEDVDMLEEAGLPLAYDHFAEGESPDPPFICFLFPGSDNFSADNTVYAEFSNLNVELYPVLYMNRFAYNYSITVRGFVIPPAAISSHILSTLLFISPVTICFSSFPV